MQEIARAIRQFKQDTGYFPKEGPFNLDSAPGGQVTTASLLADFPYSGTTAAKRQNWFNSQVNFYQLMTTVSPLNGTGHLLEQWNEETGRGWRGPYLQGVRDGYIDVGDGPNDPAIVSANGIADVDGIADPFMFRGIAGGGSEVDGNILDWSRTHRPVNAGDPAREEREKWGRPYLLLNMGTPAKLSLVSMGSDGEWDNGLDDDIVLPLE